VQARVNQKLSPKYYGPFQIVAKVGKVAYTLQLPAAAQIHPTFHVSQLKAFKGVLPNRPHIPEWVQGFEVDAVRQPIAILDRKLKKRGNRVVVQFVVQWEGQSVEDASWWDAEEIEKHFLDFAEEILRELQ